MLGPSKQAEFAAHVIFNRSTLYAAEKYNTGKIYSERHSTISHNLRLCLQFLKVMH